MFNRNGDTMGVINNRGLHSRKTRTKRMMSSQFSSHHGVKPKRVTMLKYGLLLFVAFIATSNILLGLNEFGKNNPDSTELISHMIKNAKVQEKLPKGKPSEGTGLENADKAGELPKGKPSEGTGLENADKAGELPKGKPSEGTGLENADKAGELPSAKALLDMKPPFEDSDIIKLYPAESESKPLIQSENTVVTAYFRIRSKHKSDKYDEWMRNMLSLQDAMVIFTEPGLVDQIKEMRSHAVNRTILVSLSGGLDDLPIGKLFSESFWKDQLQRDPEKTLHKSYQVFWIWLSKSWFVTQAIRMNVFGSDVFVWSDIGCFRDAKYNYRTMVQYRKVVPRHEILQMAHHKMNPPSEKLFNDKYNHKKNFYHSGSQFVGYKDTIVKFHEYFLEIIDRFLEKNMIIVEDQVVLQSVCLSYPEICAYVPYTAIRDNVYFGLRRVLNNGNEIDYWRIPSNVPP